ncbi:BGTF surface domain-containing protein [Halosimplex aquaticum]
MDGPGGSRELNLSDASGDGRIALSINSYLAGPDATATEVYGVGDGDRLSVEGEATGRLPPGSYRIAAYADGTDSEPADTAGLTLTDRGLGNATVMVAPNGSRERLDSLAAIQRAQERRWLTPTNEVAIGDTFVLRLDVPGVAGAVANESGPTDEARFRRLLAGSNTSLLLSEQMPGPSRPRHHLSLDASNTTTVVADPDNDTYYVAADLAVLPWKYSHSLREGELSFADSPLRYGNTYVPRFLVDNRSRLNPSDISEGSRTGQFAAVGPDAVVTYPGKRDGTLQAAPSSNQVVAGWTTVAPGSTVTVELSNDEGDSFPATRTVRVVQERPPGAEGAVYRYRAEFDLSEAEPGTTFDVDIRSNGTQLNPQDSWDDGPRGFVDPTLAPTATATATPTETALPAPTGTSAQTPIATGTPTATPHADPGVTLTRSQTPTATAGTTTGDGPGFGAVAALLGSLALVAFGCLPGRRDR